MNDSQEAVLAFLANPATHAGEAVKRIDTHAAVVFLAGARAFKVKRAVRFPFPRSEVEALASASRAAPSRVRALLMSRGERGLIRRIHGDLHLGNVVMLDGRPVLFDAIEFSPLIASGDILYDLAFLLMDLTERGLAPAANVVLNRYLAETRRAEDLDALAALPLFLSMRAAIRAKVGAARLAYAAPAERPPTEMSARKYFEFAWRFIAPAAPVLVA